MNIKKLLNTQVSLWPVSSLDKQGRPSFSDYSIIDARIEKSTKQIKDSSGEIVIVSKTIFTDNLGANVGDYISEIVDLDSGDIYPPDPFGRIIAIDDIMSLKGTSRIISYYL